MSRFEQLQIKIWRFIASLLPDTLVYFAVLRAAIHAEYLLNQTGPSAGQILGAWTARGSMRRLDNGQLQTKIDGRWADVPEEIARAPYSVVYTEDGDGVLVAGENAEP